MVKELYDYGFANNIVMYEYQYMAKNINKAVTISEGTMSKLEECLELLRNDRDVIHVYHNAVMLAF